MAEGGEKTEMPTPKKLRDARQKGQVCTSKDVVSTSLLVVLLFLTGAIGVELMDDSGELIRFIGRLLSQPEPPLGEAGVMAMIVVFKHSLIFIGVAFFVAVVANAVQIGVMFTIEPIKPDLKKLNPVEGAKRIFSKKNLFEFFKNVVKVTFLSYLIYKLIIQSVPVLLPICYGTVDDIMPVLKDVLKSLAGYTIFGYVIIAVVDRLFQQKNFTKEMMMTKDEVKREYKEQEGSQEIKQAQRQFRNELMSGPPPRQATKKANVVVTNPTHLAVGIRYDVNESPLPKVVVSGAGLVAKVIRDTAYVEGIPIVEDVPLARALYAKVSPDEYIPVDLVAPVAEVLKVVKALDAAEKEQRELDEIEL